MFIMRMPSMPVRQSFRPFMWDDEREEWGNVALTEGLDVYEDNDTVVVKASVPGVPEDKVEVMFENGVLTIRAHNREKEEQKDEKKVIYRMDRVTSFQYTTALPRLVDDKSIEAEVRDGVVTVRAKIAEAAKPKLITVKKAAR
jgi:HSP20 family protein